MIVRKEIRRDLIIQKEARRKEYIISMEFIEEALVVNEFNLYWKRILIAGNYGGWRKKCTEAVWKNEILNSGKLEDLFYLTLNASLIVVNSLSRIWELLRGVYNNNFNSLAKIKDHRKVVEELWCFCHEKLSYKIWINPSYFAL
ncbi:hypothetical protein RhiirA5_425995 [Rhizophagus irregularis]|uniref:Uncharacterized protein n=1 Tax=Rhizophagus irregularis TaxID=588596 RepID=A0A2N0P4Z8_9GLOM|nr:hypothetical protein RhiirA5_425995 [Rhizophagus irregularis]